MRDLSGSTFHSRASSATCSSFCQLRNAGRSPLQPVSRVFCAVGWPFICRMPAPGRPIIPRNRLTLFAAHADAVAWCDWYTPWSTNVSRLSASPRISAASTHIVCGHRDRSRRPARACMPPPSSRAPRSRPCAPPRTPGRPSRSRSAVARARSAPPGSCPAGSPDGPRLPSPTASRAGSITIERGGSGPCIRSSSCIQSTVCDSAVLIPTCRIVSQNSRSCTPAGCPSQPNVSFKRLARRRSAEAGVAVEMIRADPAARDQRQRVVVLDEQLAARVEAERRRSPSSPAAPANARPRDPSPPPRSPRRARPRAARADA